MMRLDALNALPAAEFTRQLAGVFEHSPWVAQRAAAARPFASVPRLLEALCAVVDRAALEEQLALIRAHPTLGSRGRSRASLTASSAREQRGAGLDACTDEDFVRLETLNRTYQEKFGMPFILAVRGHDPASIIRCFEGRLDQAPEQERGAALREIGKIAGYRLADLVAP